jgi:large subunit ribosomal protein L15
MPLNMRIPKLRGFNNPFRVEYQAINLDTIEASGLDEVTPDSLLANGLVSKGALVKVLGRGELTRKVTVHAHAFSKSAAAAIEAAGGSTVTVDLPF